jgi:hypothetical protein
MRPTEFSKHSSQSQCGDLTSTITDCKNVNRLLEPVAENRTIKNLKIYIYIHIYSFTRFQASSEKSKHASNSIIIHIYSFIRFLACFEKSKHASNSIIYIFKALFDFEYVLINLSVLPTAYTYLQFYSIKSMFREI